MTVVGVKPFTVNKVQVIITLSDAPSGSQFEFQKAIEAVTYAPTNTQMQFFSVDGSSYTASGASSWVANLTYVQDWENDDSLSSFLYDNAEKEATLKVVPINGGRSFTSLVTLVDGAIGGTVNSMATTSVVLPCLDGKPKTSL